MTITLVDAAMQVAIEAHGSDRNKHDGEMYTLHLARVWINVRNAGGNDVQQAVAWLHDSVEDTTLTYDDIINKVAELCDPTPYGYELHCLVEGVRGMTKIHGETNRAYYQRCKANEDSRFVKLHGDLVDNFRRNHNITDPETAQRMMQKYSLGMDILT